jgi:hypothetical protein
LVIVERITLVTLKQLCPIVDAVLLGDTVVVVVIVTGVQEVLVGQAFAGL